MIKLWSKCIVLGALLVLIAYHLSPRWDKATVAQREVSDEHMDGILRSFFDKWQTGEQDVGRFQSMMADIGRLFDDVDSVELLFRFQDQLEVIMITKSPKQEDHPKHVCGAKKKTEV